MIIGGAGYVGAVLVPKLLQEDYNVKVYDLFIARNRPIYLRHTQTLVEECIGLKMQLLILGNHSVSETDPAGKSQKICSKPSDEPF